MSWLGYALVGITIWSATAVADRFFLLRHVSNKRFYVVVPALLQFLVVLVLAIPFSIPHAPFVAITTAIAGGFIEVVCLYYLYVAVSNDEVSRVFPLTVAGPVFTLVLGWLLLHQTLTVHQITAFALFLCGGIFLATRFDHGEASFSKALKPLFIGSLLSSAFTLLVSYSFTTSSYWPGFFYSRLGFFLGGIIVLGIYRKEIRQQWHELDGRTRTALFGNQLVALSGHAFYFLALSLASAALVQSVLSVQSGIILIFAVLVSLWKKDVLQESLRSRDLLQKAVGIAFIVVASYLLVM